MTGGAGILYIRVRVLPGAMTAAPRFRSARGLIARSPGRVRDAGAACRYGPFSTASGRRTDRRPRFEQAAAASLRRRGGRVRSLRAAAKAAEPEFSPGQDPDADMKDAAAAGQDALGGVGDVFSIDWKVELSMVIISSFSRRAASSLARSWSQPATRAAAASFS